MFYMFLKRLIQRWNRPKPDAETALLPGDVNFDGAWYLSAYPDVAAAGVDPWQHYVRHGRFEGRQPCNNVARIYDEHLWRGLDDVMVPRLQQLLATMTMPDMVRDYARWSLARWWVWQDDWQQAAEVLSPMAERRLFDPVYLGPALLAVTVFLKQGRIADARRVIERYSLLEPDAPGLVLAESNILAFDKGSDTQRLALLNRMWAAHGLVQASDDQQALPMLDRLCVPDVEPASDSEAPLVSVVIPVFNAGGCLATAVRSLCQQTWPNLDIVIVDDASTDDTVNVAEQLAQQWGRPGRLIRVLAQPDNHGAYFARNSGMAAARGKYLTVHDADDWSHPEKLARQVAVLQHQAEVMATVSHWVRADDDLVFGRWRVPDNWIYRNVSSLMIRRAVFEQLGYWDEVRANADTEYYHRIRAAFGDSSIVEVLPGVPLSFGRASNTSLSQASDTHLVTQFNGARKRYMDAGHRWHASASASASGVKALYLDRGDRRFKAPESMLPQPDIQGYQVDGVFAGAKVEDFEARHLMDAFQQSEWFDAAWYVRRYPDLQQRTLDAFEHWWQCGAAEGRDPGPRFSVSGYSWQQSVQLGESQRQDIAASWSASTIARFLLDSEKHDADQILPQCEGVRTDFAGKPWVMVCGHQAGEVVFGGERSLLDVLQGLQSLALNVLLVLPEARNADYLGDLLEHCQRMAIVPMPWWQQGARVHSYTCQRLEHLITTLGVCHVYLNTVVHFEPVIAARNCGVGVTVHARELPNRDSALCDVLGATPDQVRAHALRSADVLVANSQYLANYYDTAVTALVPNVVKVADKPLPMPDAEVFRLGMISSNLPKKGLDDFVALAGELARRELPVVCVLTGPDNHHVELLKAAAARGELPGCIEFAGYVAQPDTVLSTLHAVVNLSHFEESFGRSVLEAMAAGRPVVCYSHGALPELVREGETGFLAPLGDVDAVADAIERLAKRPELAIKMGSASHITATQFYSPNVMTERLRSWAATAGLDV